MQHILKYTPDPFFCFNIMDVTKMLDVAVKSKTPRGMETQYEYINSITAAESKMYTTNNSKSCF